MIAEILYELIAGSSLTGSLATYEFTTGAPLPAIFTCERIPDDAAFPAIIIDELGGTPGGGTRGYEGGEETVRVRLYDDKNRSRMDQRNLAMDLYKLINRADLHNSIPAVEGWTCVYCIAGLPGRLDDPEGFPGYMIEARVLILERD